MLVFHRLQERLQLIHRKVLCFKCDKKVYVIKQYEGINFCVKNEVAEVTDFVEQ
jgi:hypothetical protein